MLFLFFLGPTLEGAWGRRSFLRFFLVSGMGAGIAVVIAGLLFPYFDHATLGMSGALNAMLMAFAIANPNAPMRFMFVLQMTARQLVWVVVLIEVLAAVSGNREASFPAHMGGLAMGYLLVTGNWRPSRWNLPFFKGRGKKTKLSGKAGNLRIVRSDDDDDDEPKTYLN
jgi:membrane associated rhomboid family serine protease